MSHSDFKTKWTELKQIKSFKELALQIPSEWLSFLCMLLLCALCLVPPIAAGTFKFSDVSITAVPTEDYEKYGSVEVALMFSTSNEYADHWFTINGCIAGFGLFLLVLCAASGIAKAGGIRNICNLDTVKSNLTLVFLASMLLWSIICFLFSDNKARSFLGLGFRHGGLLEFFFCAVFFCLALNVNSDHIRIILRTFNATATFLGLLCLFHPKLDVLRRLFHLSDSYDYRGIFTNSNHCGYYFCMAFMCNVAILLSLKKNSRLYYFDKILHFVTLLIIGNTLVMTKASGPVLAVFVALFALSLILIFDGNINRRESVPTILTSLLSIIVLFVIPRGTGSWNIVADASGSIAAAAAATGNTGYTGAFSGSAAYGSAVSSANSRIALWLAAVDIVKNNPIVGMGPGNIGDPLYFACGIDLPHDEPLEYAAMLGIPGIIMYLAALGCHLADFIKGFKKLNPITIGLFGIVGGYLVSSLFGNTMYYTTPFFYMFFALSRSSLKCTLGTG